MHKIDATSDISRWVALNVIENLKLCYESSNFGYCEIRERFSKLTFSKLLVRQSWYRLIMRLIELLVVTTCEPPFFITIIIICFNTLYLFLIYFISHLSEKKFVWPDSYVILECLTRLCDSLTINCLSISLSREDKRLVGGSYLDFHVAHPTQ